MKVCAISATCGRHHLMERSLRFFLDQDYINEHILLIFNNSEVTQSMSLPMEPDDMGPIKSIILVNNHISYITNEPYKNLGEIYNDALTHVPLDADVIIHWDDDDIFLPNHITEGTQGLFDAWCSSEGKIMAYKPAKSYYRHPGGIQLMSNTLEPSIFTYASHIKRYGYSNTTTDQHLQWVNPLVYEGLIDVKEDGVPTLIYNWGDVEIPTFKTSGNAGHPNNFQNYRNFSKDHGDQILTPWPQGEVKVYYDLVYAKH